MSAVKFTGGLMLPADVGAEMDNAEILSNGVADGVPRPFGAVPLGAPG